MFDREKLFKNRNKAANYCANSDFCRFVSQDLINRISILENSFQNILVVENSNRSTYNILSEMYPLAQVSFLSDAEKLPMNEDKKFDLIVFEFGLHWINDVPKILKNLCTLLLENGILIFNFAGHASLRMLRKSIIEAESKYGNVYTARLIPFIKFDSLPTLLKQAGFVENVVDMEPIQIVQDNPIAMLKFIKKLGEHSSILDKYIYFDKKIYKELASTGPNEFIDRVYLISAVCAKKRGAMQVNLHVSN